MENRKKRNIGGTILLVAAGAALTVVGFMFIPPLIQKYGNKASVIGYAWDNSNPRIQLEPRGERGYIELKAIQPV